MDIGLFTGTFGVAYTIIVVWFVCRQVWERGSN